MGLFIALASSAAQAVPIVPVTVTVDESGTGLIVLGFQSTPLTGSVITDPTSTTGSKVLAYPLPFVAAAGDVVLTEPGTTEPSDSDLIRFVLNPATPTAPTSLLLFYSDLPGAGETAQVADLGVPPAVSGAKIFAEVGPEDGPNGATYTPGSMDPGASVLVAHYSFISDPSGVPLPTSVVAGLVLLTGLGAWRLMRKRVTI